MVNKQSVSPPVPHLHALLTSGDDPPEEVDIFDLLKVSYEVSSHRGCMARSFHLVRVSAGSLSSGDLCSVILRYLTESPLARRNSAA